MVMPVNERPNQKLVGSMAAALIALKAVRITRRIILMAFWGTGASLMPYWQLSGTGRAAADPAAVIKSTVHPGRYHTSPDYMTFIDRCVNLLIAGSNMWVIMAGIVVLMLEMRDMPKYEIRRNSSNWVNELGI
ncbi:hypothetical protein GGI00_001452 [Coemansia sp. RSA 2681]|nr:hypothetical protein GGI00_001452 [Coemansia sp. RSA 2681]